MLISSVGQATSRVAMLRRHGRTPSEGEVLEAYRELVAAKIFQCISGADERGLPLDHDRSSFLISQILQRTALLSVDA